MDIQSMINAEYDAAKAIQASAEVLSEDQLSQVEAHIAKAEELEAKKAKLDAIDAKLAKVEAPAPRKTTAVAPVSTVENVKALFEEDPKKGFKNEQEFFKAVYNVTTGKVAASDNMKFLAVQGQDEQHTLSDSLGGYLVPEGFDPSVKEITPESNPFAGRTFNLPMDKPSVTINARVDKNHSKSVAGGVVVGRRQETQDIKTSQMTFEQITLKATEQAGASFQTFELLEDSPSSVAAILANGFTQAFADADFEEFLRGSGVGAPQGVQNSAAFVGVNRTGAGLIDIDDVLNIRKRVWGYSNAIWIANHDTMSQLAKLQGGAGSAFSLIYMPSSQTDVPDMLLGRPLFYSEYADKLGDKNDLQCINASQYLTGTYKQLQTAESTHVRFLANENVFKMWKRNDGRSWWTSALTPKRGAATLSPFVGLNA
jgi:HK97 family phage major capsid protein